MDCAIRVAVMISLLISIKSSGKQSRHVNDGGVEDVEDELRGDADGEHEQSYWNNDELFASPKIDKCSAAFGERAAEEGLHGARERDGGHEQTDYRDGRE